MGGSHGSSVHPASNDFPLLRKVGGSLGIGYEPFD